MAPRNNGNREIGEIKVGLKALIEEFRDHRTETRGMRDETKREIASLRHEVVQRAESHERSDAAAFLSLNTAVATLDRKQVGDEAVSRYKRWLFGTGIAGGISALGMLLKSVIDYFRG